MEKSMTGTVTKYSSPDYSSIWSPGNFIFSDLFYDEPDPGETCDRHMANSS